MNPQPPNQGNPMLQTVQDCIKSFDHPLAPYFKAVKLANGSISTQLQFKAMQTDKVQLPNAEAKARVMLALIDHIRASTQVEVNYRDSYKDANGNFIASSTIYCGGQTDTRSAVEAGVAAAFKTLGLTAEDVKVMLAKKATETVDVVIDQDAPAV